MTAQSSKQRPKFLKPGENWWEEDKSEIDPNNATTFVYNPYVSFSLEQQRQQLPIFSNRSHILYLLEKFQTLVLVGETGCGKSTQVPQYLVEAGWAADGKIVGVTEPRRVAATTLAMRVAEEKNCMVGQLVGYSIRFDDNFDPEHTKIKYMTEGILLREMMADPLLRNYCVIMLDEVHERTLFTDIVMGLLKKILRKRKNLKLIVTSATVDAEHLKNFFSHSPSNKDTAVIMSVQGRLYPVDVFYLKVVDSGFVKLRWFNPENHADSLVVVPVSQASAEQRAGRAGRVRSGKVYRLYTEDAFKELVVATPPEMQRTDLSMAILQLKALGIDNVLRFNFPSPPPAKNLLSGLELLYALGALDKDGQLTKPLGVTMAEFPIEPLFSKCLIISGEFGCSEEMLSIVAMLQVQNVFTKPSIGQLAIKARIAKRKFEVSEGDLLTYLNVYNSFIKHEMSREWCHMNFLNYKGLRRASEIRQQMSKLLQHFNIPITSCEGNSEVICRCITAGLFPNAVYLHYSGVYKTVRGDQVLNIHPTSVLYTLEQPQWLLFCEILYTNEAYMRDLIVIQPSWLEELAPHFYQKTVDKDY